MDAFKLLSRSTNLKTRNSFRREQCVPSEGQTRYPGSQADEGGLNRSAGALAGKKRKRDASHPVVWRAKESTSNRSDGLGLDHHGQRESIPPALDKKLTYMSPALNEIDTQGRLSPDECRSILKSHKIKITLLAGDRHGTTLLALDHRKDRGKKKLPKIGSLSRKKQKEASRLYPQPLISFTQLRHLYGVSRTLSQNILEQGYINPTEVQLATIPLLLEPTIAGVRFDDCSNVDILTIAPTGSGKTLAFLIPLIKNLQDDRHRGISSDPSRHVRALIVAPTKELVGQIVNEGRKLCMKTGISITPMRKGMCIDVQDISSNSEDRGEATTPVETPGTQSVVKSDVLVTTPLLLANTISVGKASLANITYLVLDEADVLLDLLFRDQTTSLWDACTSPLLRVSLWSATIGSNIEELVSQMLKDRQARLGHQTQNPLLRCIVGLKDSALPIISHQMIYVATEPGKLLGLRQLLHPSTKLDGGRTVPSLRPPFLVFTQTIERAIALHAELQYDIPNEAGGSSRIAVLHSDLSDLKRSDIMARFRKGQVWILITTDLLSRGVDFRGVNGVVNYDIPTTTAAYVHRVGRTGRAGRKGGMAVTFYTKEDIKYVKPIANAITASERARGKEDHTNEDATVQRWLLHTLPDISKKDKQELKKRGVGVRRKIRADEDDSSAKAKRKARISTKSGFERRLENKRKGAKAAAERRRAAKEDESDDSDAWSGLDGS